jgi:serine/threonine protein kinase
MSVRSQKQIGNYLLSRPIGSGGQGSVYVAEHVRTREVAALKLFRLGTDEDYAAELAKRIEREVAALQRVTNEVVVKVIESNKFDVAGDPTN